MTPELLAAAIAATKTVVLPDLVRAETLAAFGIPLGPAREFLLAAGATEIGGIAVLAREDLLAFLRRSGSGSSRASRRGGGP